LQFTLAEKTHLITVIQGLQVWFLNRGWSNRGKKYWRYHGSCI